MVQCKNTALITTTNTLEIAPTVETKATKKGEAPQVELFFQCRSRQPTTPDSDQPLAAIGVFHHALSPIMSGCGSKTTCQYNAFHEMLAFSIALRNFVLGHAHGNGPLAPFIHEVNQALIHKANEGSFEWTKMRVKFDPERNATILKNIAAHPQGKKWRTHKKRPSQIRHARPHTRKRSKKALC